jgi:hypothetical protein
MNARLMARYSIDTASKLARMLMAKIDEEVAIEPIWMTSWDFSQLMQDAVKA